MNLPEGSWRLPTQSEISDLFNANLSDLIAADWTLYYLWSSSPDTINGGPRHVVVDLGNGDVRNQDDRTGAYFSCVTAEVAAPTKPASATIKPEVAAPTKPAGATIKPEVATPTKPVNNTPPKLTFTVSKPTTSFLEAQKKYEKAAQDELQKYMEKSKAAKKAEDEKVAADKAALKEKEEKARQWCMAEPSRKQYCSCGKFLSKAELAATKVCIK